ncbi:MAG: hydantoinase/oxoprolinase family protein, partial [Candidatus Odinarchaeia archaeon]
MVFIVGLDIGGANTKFTIIKINNSRFSLIESHIFYYPFWKRDLNSYIYKLKENIEKYIYLNDIDYFACTLTAELVDIFESRKDGVLKIINMLEKLTPTGKLIFYSIDFNLLNFEEAINEPLKLAAANWISTGELFSKIFPNCIVIDMGSTTTDFIIIVDKKIVNKGKTDLERLYYNELFYSGFLRTPIPTITDKIKFRNRDCFIASEFFAIMADVHLILDNISVDEYLCD